MEITSPPTELLYNVCCESPVAATLLPGMLHSPPVLSEPNSNTGGDPAPGCSVSSSSHYCSPSDLLSSLLCSLLLGDKVYLQKDGFVKSHCPRKWQAQEGTQ